MYVPIIQEIGLLETYSEVTNHLELNWLSFQQRIVSVIECEIVLA